MTNLEFNASLLKMKPKLQRFAMSLVADREKAPDLVQDTFLKALNYKNKFADFTNFNAWVFTIMKNTFINNYRRNIKENNIIDKIQDLDYADHPHVSVSSSPESNFTVEEIETTIDLLSNEFKVPFRMHIDGYKYKEIADELGLKIGTVKSRIFLSRQKLMLMLRDYNE
jgi:RNA polymerase sigma-70 factor (ECF subfamily)